MSEWISVEDKLPQSGCDVLVMDSSKNYFVVWHYGEADFGCQNDDFDTDQVTHWMPLPKPPEIHS